MSWLTYFLINVCVVIFASVTFKPVENALLKRNKTEETALFWSNVYFFGLILIIGAACCIYDDPRGWYFFVAFNVLATFVMAKLFTKLALRSRVKAKNR